MITYVTGDLFHSPAQVLVNTVNTVGVMGKGVAYEFKRRFPDMFKEYRLLCEQGRFQIGDLWLYNRHPTKWVLNFPTKQHWRNPSKPDYIEIGLKAFRQKFDTRRIYSIAFPALGCGNGELDFETQVRPLMERYLGDLPIDVFIYPDRLDPYPAEHADPKQFREWLRSQPETLAFTEVWDDLRNLLAEHKTFTTVARNSDFTAEIMSNRDGIKVIASGHTYIVERETLLSFWRQLRDYGFSMRKIAPRINKTISYLIPIFSMLDYVRIVRISDEYEDLRGNSSVGLQYIPIFLKPTGQSTQLPLFEFA